jgi:acetoin utilization deacetylase AcuC-like enzyme
MKVAFDPIYAHPLPEGHRFPMEKYALLPEQLLREGVIDESDFYSPNPLRREKVERIHDAEYIDKLEGQSLTRQEERRTGFPLSPKLVEREYTISGGSVQNVKIAKEEGVALNIAGGTHHAFRDRGEGFCLFNDIALAADHILEEEPNSQLLVVDLDVHQGNGTASIFTEEKRVFTFSMHGRNNYPLHK